MTLKSNNEFTISKDKHASRQVKAMSAWCNQVLKPRYEHQDRSVLRERATLLFISSCARDTIRLLGENRMFFIRADCNVYSDLTIQASLLHVFLSFHPVWLQLGLETIFETEIMVRSSEDFPHLISQFIQRRLFSEPKIINNERLLHVGKRAILTDAGREAINLHFIVHTLQFLYFVELAISKSILDNGPPMFTKNSEFKCMEAVFSKISRRLLSGAGASISKVFAIIGFVPSFRQNYFDDKFSTISTLEDFTDGVVLGRIIELVSGRAQRSLVCRLRDPHGESWRKFVNVRICFQAAAEWGIHIQDVDLRSLVSGNSDTVLEIFWNLAGIYIYSCYLPKLEELSRNLTVTASCCQSVSELLQYLITSLSDVFRTFSRTSLLDDDADVESESRKFKRENCINGLCDLKFTCEHFCQSLSLDDWDELNATIDLMKTL